MRKIFKYQLATDHRDQQFELHGADPRVVSVAMQGGVLCMWIEADTSKSKVARKFAVFGTGHDLPDHEWQWCGTVHVHPYVWHVYGKL